jgi:3-phenylpropionate/trans-cinnamate dioxygenase ferredoxin subunit
VTAGKEVLGPLAELAPGTARRYDVAGRSIAVVRIEDAVYAIGDVCSHQDVSLAEGEVDEDERTLECWKHGSAFDLASGEALTLPATQPVPTYEARIEGDEIVVVFE